MQGSDWEKGVKGVKGQISGSRRSTEVEIYPEMCITSGHLEHRWVSVHPCFHYATHRKRWSGIYTKMSIEGKIEIVLLPHPPENLI